MPGVSGVGISFGADRIYDVLNTLELYPTDTEIGTKVMFTNFGTAEAAASMKMIKALRQNNISAEIYPESSKMKKQMSYANDLAIPFVAIIGESELADGKVTLKDMNAGTQESVDLDTLIERLR
jgi:histidyl-tRNA synthetase